jgi:hypothetical protein
MTNTEIANKLRDICSRSAFESTHSVYLKNAVVIGSNPNGAVLATYINNNLNSFYDVDKIVVNAILNERKCDLYGKDYDFEFIIYDQFNDHTPTSKNGTELFSNALELILAELESSGDEWLEYQKNLRIRNRHFHRWAINAWSGGKRKENYPELTWEERLEWVSNKGECDYLMWRRPRENNQDLKTLVEMNELGEIAYNEKQAKQNAIMRELMKDLKL